MNMAVHYHEHEHLKMNWEYRDLLFLMKFAIDKVHYYRVNRASNSTDTDQTTIIILKFGTPQTIAIIVLKIEKFDVTLH